MFAFAETLKWFCPEVGGVAPPPLAAHGCAVIGASIYIFGGLSPAGPGAQDTLYCLNTGKSIILCTPSRGPALGMCVQLPTAYDTAVEKGCGHIYTFLQRELFGPSCLHDPRTVELCNMAMFRSITMCRKIFYMLVGVAKPTQLINYSDH